MNEPNPNHDPQACERFRAAYRAVHQSEATQVERALGYRRALVQHDPQFALIFAQLKYEV